MDLIRGRNVDDAISMLRFSKQRASGMVEKVIRSAVANANEQSDEPIDVLPIPSPGEPAPEADASTVAASGE